MAEEKLSPEQKKKLIEDHVDYTLHYFRDRIDVLAAYGLEMEDFLVLEKFIVDRDSITLNKVYNLILYTPDAIEADNQEKVTVAMLGAILGYIAGMKDTHDIYNNDFDGEKLTKGS